MRGNREVVVLCVTHTLATEAETIGLFTALSVSLYQRGLLVSDHTKTGALEGSGRAVSVRKFVRNREHVPVCVL